jgi:hypothetical protein
MYNTKTTTMRFVNDTDLPIIVSSWRIQQEGTLAGLTSYKDVTILPKTGQKVYSNVEEWIIGSEFFSDEYNNQWIEEGLYTYGRIAKFSNKPCAMGNYTWNFIEDHFTIEHNNGVITWRRIPEKTI